MDITHVSNLNSIIVFFQVFKYEFALHPDLQLSSLKSETDCELYAEIINDVLMSLMVPPEFYKRGGGYFSSVYLSIIIS